jgi:hypothetical protein
MDRRVRVKGGEKNNKSGQKWTKDELSKVLNFYVSNREVKIHESNPDIQSIAKVLGRTTRSVEAQLLMFRALDKLGNYGYKNMNSLCKILWKEYINDNLK